MPEEKTRVSIKRLTEELNALKEMIKMKGVMELLLEDRKKDSVQNSMVRLDSYYFNSSVCNRGFVTKFSFKKHIKEEHQQKVHCEICQETFDENCRLEAHMEEHAKQKEHELKAISTQNIKIAGRTGFLTDRRSNPQG